MLRAGHGHALRHVLRLLVAALLGARGYDERGGQRTVGVRDRGGRGGRLPEARVQHGQLDGQLEGALIFEPALTKHGARHRHNSTRIKCHSVTTQELTDRVLACVRACVLSKPVGTTGWLSGAPTPRGQLWACACAGGGGPGNFEMTLRHWPRRPLGGGRRREGSKITPNPNSQTVDKGCRRQPRSSLFYTTWCGSGTTIYYLCLTPPANSWSRVDRHCRRRALTCSKVLVDNGYLVSISPYIHWPWVYLCWLHKCCIYNLPLLYLSS